MISKRYKSYSSASIHLNSLQLKMRDQVARKIVDGDYETETVSCCVCNSTDQVVLSEKDRYGLYHRVVVCPVCGLVYTSPRMIQESYSSFYDNEYRLLYHGKDIPYEDLFDVGCMRGKEIAYFIENNGYDLHQAKVLEVGCGAGGALHFLREHHKCDIYGLDLGSDGIMYGRSKYNLNIEEGSLKNISLPWRPDYIIYSHVFEHILDLNKECEFIKGIIHQSSLIYIEVPSIKNIRDAYNWDFLKYLQNAHTYHFTKQSLENVLHQNKFSSVSSNEFTRSLFRFDGINKKISFRLSKRCPIS